MSDRPSFVAAHPYQTDVLALPVKDAGLASRWYAQYFGLAEVERWEQPCPTIVMERDGVRIGFAESGGVSANDGAAIEVVDIAGLREELEGRGVSTANWRVDERDGKNYQVFFVVAPDELCYYFYEALD